MVKSKTYTKFSELNPELQAFALAPFSSLERAQLLLEDDLESAHGGYFYVYPSSELQLDPDEPLWFPGVAPDCWGFTDNYFWLYFITNNSGGHTYFFRKRE